MKIFMIQGYNLSEQEFYAITAQNLNTEVLYFIYIYRSITGKKRINVELYFHA